MRDDVGRTRDDVGRPRDDVEKEYEMETISLDELLASRDARQAAQQQLMAANPESALVCLTVVMPGSVKRSGQSLTVAKAAVETLKHELNDRLSYLEERDLQTGYEAFLLVSMSPLEAKRATCAIEETHPLGRLFDIDVMSPEGPVPREAVGLQPRRCMICENEARWCMRNRTHTQEELLTHIKSLIDNYVRGI